MVLHTATYGDSGSRIVFLHGLFGQGRNWTTIARSLADTHRATVVDLPHHGRSPWLETFDYLQIADMVADLIKLHDPAAVVGHSMGGKVAMVLALRHPHLVSRLCVVDMAPVTYPRSQQFQSYIEAMRSLELGPDASREDADAALAYAVPDPGVRSFLLQNLRRDAFGWTWQMNLEVLGRDLDRISGWPSAQLGPTRPYGRPVLWIAGQDSPYIRADYRPVMKAFFPHVRNVTVKGAGHWVHADRPEIVTELLRDFTKD
ncbi:esterase [Nocardioides baekrokdamisoli]|uniref:Esterase n=1 Tax=Nocardioides baekrokdamisoli TaxID=1804624 RepID=A0A3G9IBE5_9ACTN|nr:alpha/beta fold hydrolase [Nocardioides baekrokdamisoli]BBH16150.1 esterase [Nocardioides baekrokdamisoli]